MEWKKERWRIHSRQIVSCMTSHQIGKKSHSEPHQSGDIESPLPLGLLNQLQNPKEQKISVKMGINK